VSTKWAWYWT